MTTAYNQAGTQYQQGINYSGTATLRTATGTARSYINYDSNNVTFDDTKLYDDTTTATWQIIKVAVATGTGTGSSTTTATAIPVRTATGTGNGTSTTVSLIEHLRTATATGTGTSTISSLTEHIRTATGSGTGSSTVTAIEELPRTATGSGAGSTGASVTWNKLFIFRPPVNDSFAWNDRLRPVAGDFLLRKLVPGTRAKNVYKLTDGSYTTNQPAEVEDYLLVHLGAHNNFVSASEKADLISAGYGEYVT
jgi:hypothetical protein